jgi:hypothetical protein
MTKDVYHQTRNAADISLAKKQISPDSYRAVLAGQISLRDARELGHTPEYRPGHDGPGGGHGDVRDATGAAHGRPAGYPPELPVWLWSAP